MSRERWLPHQKVVTVWSRPEAGVVVRPRRMSPWTGAAIGTSIAAGFCLSAAIARVQALGFPPPGSVLLVVAMSAVIALLQGHTYRHHPERWRFLGWWIAFVLTKIAFIDETFFLVLPVELLALLPAWWTTKQAARVADGDLQGADLAASNVAYVHIVDSNFTGADLRTALFTEVRFQGCRFNGVDASGARFENCTFVGCDFRDARLFQTKWLRVDAQGCLFARATLTGAEFEAADLRNADFENADLCGAKFWQAEGTDSRLHGARLAGARYDRQTSWSQEVTPVKSGAIRVD
ncbi:MAG: pentapeptide repeat-containing protein [Fimbriimonas sp.]